MVPILPETPTNSDKSDTPLKKFVGVPKKRVNSDKPRQRGVEVCRASLVKCILLKEAEISATSRQMAVLASFNKMPGGLRGDTPRAHAASH